MKRVTGIGGVFFKSKDVASINEWYTKELGFKIGDWGAAFTWGDVDPGNRQVYSTAWSPFKDDSKHFAPSTLPFMINYRVHDMKNLIDTLRAEGVEVVGGIDEYDYGKFAWIMDSEGRKIELWEPVDTGFGEPDQPWDKKVTSLAGVFIRSENPAKTKAWYTKHLGIEDSYPIRDITSNKTVSVSWQTLDGKSEIFSGIDKPYVFAYHAKDMTGQASLTDPEGNKVILKPNK